MHLRTPDCHRAGQKCKLLEANHIGMGEVVKPWAYSVKTACIWMKAAAKPYCSNMVCRSRSLLPLGFRGGSVKRILHSVGSTCNCSKNVWSHMCCMSFQFCTMPFDMGCATSKLCRCCEHSSPTTMSCTLQVLQSECGLNTSEVTCAVQSK